MYSLLTFLISINLKKDRGVIYMVDYLILTEKPSAAENFSTALGGKN